MDAETTAPLPRLPRGRHGLSRAEVQGSQRARMLHAFADALIEKGYVNASVADVLQRSGVSRATFYEQFSSKLDCFMHAFDMACEVMFTRLEARPDRDQGSRIERFERYFTTYLEVLAEQPALSRVFLVEVYAAGPEAIQRRGEVQARMIQELAEILVAKTTEERFACEMLVASVSSLVTRPLIDGDIAALHALRQPVVDVVRAIIDE